MLTLEVTEDQVFRCLEKHSRLLDRLVVTADEHTWLRWQSQRFSNNSCADYSDRNQDSFDDGSKMQCSRRKRHPVKVTSVDLSVSESIQQENVMNNKDEIMDENGSSPTDSSFLNSTLVDDVSIKQEPLDDIVNSVPPWMRFSTDEILSQANIGHSLSAIKNFTSIEHPKVVGIDVIRPYTCDFCPKRFTQKAHQQKHLRVHTGERPYRCEVCLKQFTQSSHLNTHMRIHTGDRPYQCTMCPQRFKQSNALHRHLQSHLGEKPYSCSICGHSFANKISLQRHHLTLHTIVDPDSVLEAERALQNYNNLNHADSKPSPYKVLPDVSKMSFSSGSNILSRQSLPVSGLDNVLNHSLPLCSVAKTTIAVDSKSDISQYVSVPTFDRSPKRTCINDTVFPVNEHTGEHGGLRNELRQVQEVSACVTVSSDFSENSKNGNSEHVNNSVCSLTEGSCHNLENLNQEWI